MEEKDIDQKAIRTYESDIANALQHRQTSQASIVIATEEKKHQQEKVAKAVIVKPAITKTPRDHSKLLKNIVMTLLSLILLASGIAITLYFYKTSVLSIKQPATPAPAPTLITTTGIITADSQKIIDITNQNSSQIISQIQNFSQNNSLSNGGILEIILGHQASTTQNNTTVTSLTRITGPQFISIIGLNPPNALTSSLTDQWMLGIYSSKNDEVTDSTSTANSSTSSTISSPFIILTNNFFQNTFAGMLAWEPTMTPDLSSFFGIGPTEWSLGSFHDKLIKNKDVREFTDNNGKTLLLYSFINNSTLVIAQNEATLSEIITRFENQAYVR